MSELQITTTCQDCGENFVDEGHNISFYRDECVCDRCLMEHLYQDERDAASGGMVIHFNPDLVPRMSIKLELWPLVRVMDQFYAGGALVIFNDHPMYQIHWEPFFKEPRLAYAEAQHRMKDEIELLTFRLQEIMRSVGAK